MPSPLQKEFSFFELYQNIGKPVSPTQKRKAAAQVNREDEITDLRQAHLERNIQRAPAPEVKPELEKMKSDLTSDLEIVETQNDPEDIDVLYKSQVYQGRLCPYSKLI